ncbi:uncharacterized protein LOC108821370 isoform X3 [Raphanus sativus]|uniref:Uncharacterized protein LOC108821370 isoform X3 n=1 Tax=Raphanus sativus TaxID=3726 RepID=A0A9W3C8L7_RAPSA|nr:uncharacterized protein LOC108821370 isoform X3 [Raphanus sativus]
MRDLIASGDGDEYKKSGRSSSTVEVRLLRFWEAKNVRRGGELTGVDMLLVDSQLLMQISLLQVGLSETIKSLVDVPPQLRLGCSNSWNLGMSNAVRNSCAFIFSCWMQRDKDEKLA